jgi:hypothetical protein
VLRILPGSAAGAAQLSGDPITATFDKTPLADVMTTFSEHIDVPMAVDPTLAATPITASYRQTPFGAAFADVLAKAGAGFETDFGYEVIPAAG